MIAVSDTTPLNYLVLIDQVDVLEKLYGTVAIPSAVLRELQSPSTPRIVKNWITQLPDWLSVKPVSPLKPPPQRLHRGEYEAMLLADELKADVLLIDEKAGRAEATRRGIPVTGTLGALLNGAQRGWVKFPDAVRDLRSSGFRLSSQLERYYAERYRELVLRQDDHERER
jgi:predicted nucleic acid-binding protein